MYTDVHINTGLPYKGIDPIAVKHDRVRKQWTIRSKKLGYDQLLIFRSVFLVLLFINVRKVPAEGAVEKAVKHLMKTYGFVSSSILTPPFSCVTQVRGRLYEDQFDLFHSLNRLLC